MAAMLQEWQAQFRSFNRAVRLFLLFNFIWNFGLGMFGIVYNLYLKALGFEQTMVGHVVGITALGIAVAIVPAGLIFDRKGMQPLVLTGMAGVLLALAARSWLVDSPSLLMSGFCFGLSLALVNATIIPFLASQSTGSQRVHLFSLNAAFVMLANMLGIARRLA